MARFLRQSTVATVKLGPFVSPSDTITPFVSGGFAVKLASLGGALSARHDGAAITYDADGFYAVELDATDTAVIGRLKAEVAGSAGNYLPVWDDFVVLSGAVYDSIFGAVALSTYAGGAVASVTGSVGSVAAGVTLAENGLDAITVEAGINARQALSPILAAAAGVLAGAAGTTVTIAAAGNPSTIRISATVDASGNRSAVTLVLPT